MCLSTSSPTGTIQITVRTSGKPSDEPCLTANPAVPASAAKALAYGCRCRPSLVPGGRRGAARSSRPWTSGRRWVQAKSLPPDPGIGAYPVRWWNARTILAYSTAPGKYMPRLWLVPVSGARAVPLTPQRTSAAQGDFGDVDAWQLPSGLYVQGLAGCGGPNLYRQAANGSITRVTIPHTTGSAYVATAAGARLLIQAQTGCDSSNSLLWFNPGTRAEQWLLQAPATAFGVTSVVPFYTRENDDR
jgi:hypothetical protein